MSEKVNQAAVSAMYASVYHSQTVPDRTSPSEQTISKPTGTQPISAASSVSIQAITIISSSRFAAVYSWLLSGFSGVIHISYSFLQAALCSTKARIQVADMTISTSAPSPKRRTTLAGLRSDFH